MNTQQQLKYFEAVSISWRGAPPSLHRGNTSGRYELPSNSKKNKKTFPRLNLRAHLQFSGRQPTAFGNDVTVTTEKGKPGGWRCRSAASSSSSPFKSLHPPLWVTGLCAVRKLSLSSQSLLGTEGRRFKAVAVTQKKLHLLTSRQASDVMTTFQLNSTTIFQVIVSQIFSRTVLGMLLLSENY